MAERYLKSLIWLVGFGGLGFGLFVTITPNEENIRKDLPGLEPRSESLKKKERFLSVLQAAAESNKPLYRLNPEDIYKELKK